jgi:hypothetical protein
MRVENLKSKLLAMAEYDRRVRADRVASGELFAGYNERPRFINKMSNASTV